MLLKAYKGELSSFKSKIGSSDIPKEALSFLTGLQSDVTSIRIDSLNENYDIETSDLNALELACVGGHYKIV